MTAPLNWTRRMGRSMAYYTADTPVGRVRISRINKFGQAAFRVYYPDGKQITQSTVEQGKAVAEAYMASLAGAK
jgi:hypothetical protein